MKPFTLFPFYIFSIVTLYSLSYGMDMPQTPAFVRDILTLTTQCINAESTHLQDWINNPKNPLFELQLKILGGYLTTKDTDKTNAPIFLLLDPVASQNKIILKQIDEIDIVEKKGGYHINKGCLRNFRIGMVVHNQLIEQELESIKQSLQCPETTRTARTESIIYAKELVGISEPRLSYYQPQEEYIIKQLRAQRILFQIHGLTDENPTIKWFKDQKTILEQYLNIQNEYIIINSSLSDQEKNKRYAKELEKTLLAIEKHNLKIKMKRTRECFFNFPCLITLQKHKKYVEELQRISPTPEKAKTIELISFIETNAQAKLEAEKEKKEKQEALLKEQHIQQAQEAQRQAEDNAQKEAEIKTQQETEDNAQQETEVQQLATIKTQQEKETQESAPHIPQITIESTDNPTQPSIYEKFVNILTAPFRFLRYISDLLWFMHG